MQNHHWAHGMHALSQQAINRPPRPKPSKQHFILDYMIKEESVELNQTNHNVYTLNFKYVASSPLTISVFTFVEESFHVDTDITEDLKPNPNLGNQQHQQLPPGEGMEAHIKDLMVVCEEKYNFGANIVNCCYPLLIRLVGL